MGFLGRLLHSLTGRSKYRLPGEMAILGAPAELVQTARRMSDLKQEEAFISFVEGRHACMLDWRAQRDDVYAELTPLLSHEERRLLPPPNSVPDDASSAIAQIRQAFAESPRALVHTESFGDFSFLVLVPREKEQEFLACVDPWLIDDEMG